MNRNMRLLFERMRDGVVIVAPDGCVRYANPEAAKLLPMVVGAVLEQAQLRRQLEAARQGHVALPLRFQLDMDTQQAGLEAHLLASPVGEDFIVVLHDDGARQLYETSIRNLLTLVQESCAEPAEDCLNALTAAFDALGDADTPALQQARRAWQLLQTRLTELTMLAAASARAPLDADERIPVESLLNDALASVREQAVERRVALTIAVEDAELPTVYGSQAWLSRAMAELIGDLVDGCNVGGEVLVTARPHGEFLSIRCEGHGRPIPTPHRERYFLPFAANAQRNWQALRGLGLGLPLAKTVIERFGGHVRLDDGDEPSLTVELPIGAPRQVESLDQAQMERYARDLGRLLERRAGAANQA